MHGGAAALSGRAGIQDPEVLEPLDVRHVGVAVDDGMAVGEARGEAGLAARGGAGDMHHPDPRLAHLGDVDVRQRFLERGLVHIPGDTLDRRPERAQLLEECRRDEVAAVEDEIGGAEQTQALVREPPRSAGQVRVRYDHDSGQDQRAATAPIGCGSRRNRALPDTSSSPTWISSSIEPLISNQRTRNARANVLVRCRLVSASSLTTSRYEPRPSFGNLNSVPVFSRPVPLAPVTRFAPRKTETS
jgi:hypothetical protein